MTYRIRQNLIKILIALLFSLMLISSADAKNIVLDEATFNEMAERARLSYVYEERAKFFEERYEGLLEKTLDLSNSYKDDITLKNSIIASQINLDEINKNTISQQDITISLQDTKIHKLENMSFWNRFLIFGLTAAGSYFAYDNDNSGAAIGIGVAGVSYLWFSK